MVRGVHDRGLHLLWIPGRVRGKHKGGHACRGRGGHRGAAVGGATRSRAHGGGEDRAARRAHVGLDVACERGAARGEVHSRVCRILGPGDNYLLAVAQAAVNRCRHRSAGEERCVKRVGRPTEREQRGDARIAGDARGEEVLGTTEDRTDGPCICGVANPAG